MNWYVEVFVQHPYCRDLHDPTCTPIRVRDVQCHNKDVLMSAHAYACMQALYLCIAHLIHSRVGNYFWLWLRVSY